MDFLRRDGNCFSVDSFCVSLVLLLKFPATERFSVPFSCGDFSCYAADGESARDSFRMYFRGRNVSVATFSLAVAAFGLRLRFRLGLVSAFGLRFRLGLVGLFLLALGSVDSLLVFEVGLVAVDGRVPAGDVRLEGGTKHGGG